jgi:hypothetical protein
MELEMARPTLGAPSVSLNATLQACKRARSRTGSAGHHRDMRVQWQAVQPVLARAPRCSPEQARGHHQQCADEVAPEGQPQVRLLHVEQRQVVPVEQVDILLSGAE